MGLTLSSPPGYSDQNSAILAAGFPALGIEIAKIYTNSAFGKLRCEVFQDHYKNGDVIPLPVSKHDGYQYQRDELLYVWAVESSADKESGWHTGEDSLWFCGWLVDQSTGQVFCDEWYRRSGSHYDPVHTNDGVLRVFTIAQRIKNDLIMASSPTLSAITAGWMALDAAFKEELAQALNEDAKFSVVNTEVFYLGEYYNGQTVTLPHSAADGYAYSAGECRFQPSWRWTSVGNSTRLVQPLVSKGQMATMKASVNGSGAVSCSVAYVDDNDALTTYTTDGRIAVFAFCTRSATPTGLTLSGFEEISYDDMMPGSPLPFDTVVERIASDINEALGTPEFFGPTVYADGATIPLPVSHIDSSYTYARGELHYIYEISDTTNASGSHLRVPIWYTDINSTTGLVKVNVWRLPPGGPEVDDDNTLGRITVTVMARRQQPAAATAITAISPNPSGSTSASVGTQDVPTVSAIIVDSTSDSTLVTVSTTSFTLSQTPVKFIGIFYNGVFKRTGFTQSGTSLTTSFPVEAGETLDAIYVT
jgi:hypothetical protein